MTITAEPLHNQLKLFFLSRKNFYQVLYFLFSEPINAEGLFELRDNGNIQELEEVHEGGRILSDFFEHLSNKQIGKVQEEYQRLFVGPGPLVAPPWESYYRSKEHLLFEEWTFQAREQYHRFGLQNIMENNEPDDHLLLELEFMIFLTNACLLEPNMNRIIDLIASQIHFIEDHLAVWIPYFCKKIIENTTSQLYLGAAMMLEDFLNFDLQTLYEVREALADV